MSRTWTPRLSIEISQAQARALQDLLPHGTKVKVLHAIIDDLIELLQTEHGPLILGGILSRRIKLSDYTKRLIADEAAAAKAQHLFDAGRPSDGTNHESPKGEKRPGTES